MRRLLLALLASCGDDVRPLTSCPGEAPAIDSCSHANFSATCGDAEGEPRFACDDTGYCNWFTNGCVADGYVASDCPAEDLCCHDDWPFVDRREIDHYSFYGNGTAPWDPTRSTVLGVEIDPELTATATTYGCEGELFGGGGATPCTENYEFQADGSVGDTLIVHGGQLDLYGWHPLIEILPQSSGEPRARVCTWWFTDVAGGACGRTPESVCAREGTIRLNRLPTSQEQLSGLVIALDVQMKDLHLTGTVVLP